MKPCKEFAMQLPLLISGDLEPGKANSVRQHLAICAECSRRFEEMNRVVRIISREELKPSENFGPELITRIHSRTDRNQTGWRHLWKTVPAIGVIALMVLLLNGPLHFSNDTEIYSELELLSAMTHTGLFNMVSEVDYTLKNSEIDISGKSDDYLTLASNYLSENMDYLSGDYIETMIESIDDEAFNQIIENIKTVKL